MTGKTYKQIMENAHNLMKKENYKEAEHELDAAYRFKPVSMEWTLMKAACRYELGSSDDEVQGLLDDKISLNGYNEMVDDYYSLKMKILGRSEDYIKDRERIFIIKYKDWYQENTNEDAEFYMEKEEKLLEMCANFNGYRENHEECINLAKLLYAFDLRIPYLIFAEYFKNVFGCDICPEIDWIRKSVNAGYLIEQLISENPVPFIIVESSELDSVICRFMADILSNLGMKVYYIGLPVEYESKDKLEKIDLLGVTLENIDKGEKITKLTPVRVKCNSCEPYDNKDYIIHYLISKKCPENLATVLAGGAMTDNLCMTDLLKKSMERLSPFEHEFTEENIAFGWAGDYLSYISRVYLKDCHKLIEEKPKKRFSIVIPARNSSATLKYTLKTCLEQTYSGSYEIILSDNSTGGNMEVYDLYKELNDDKIRYLKTPRDLRLPKSFEYAYLHAEGEYIFAIGSDDGVLPWALEVLDEVVGKYPDEEIIEWERGFYAWPGFNHGQQNQFVIPREYKKGQFDYYYTNNVEYISSVLKYPESMYLLPLLYINSCFKRCYLKTLIERTGRLWDGECQDIYMGVINSCINEKILNITYPITIAGMCSNSIGASSNLCKSNEEEYKRIISELAEYNNIGGFCASYFERFLPGISSDASTLYDAILRAVSRGVLPETYLKQVFDWKLFFNKLFSSYDIRDISFDKKIRDMRYAASKQGTEFLKWFDGNIYNVSMEPRFIDEEEIKILINKKTYESGRNEIGGITLDGSDYGVKDIYGAVKLFAEIWQNIKEIHI